MTTREFFSKNKQSNDLLGNRGLFQDQKKKNPGITSNALTGDDCAIHFNRKNHSNESRTEAADGHTFDNFIPNGLSDPHPYYNDDDMSIAGSFFGGG